MTVGVILQDGGGNGASAKVSTNGEQVVRPFRYSEPSSADLDAVDTAFNLWPPLPSQRFIITGEIVSTNKDVGVNGATIIIYEASSAEATVVDKTLAKIDLLRNDKITREGLFKAVTLGKYVNVQTDDDVVFITVEGYYVPDFEE